MPLVMFAGQSNALGFGNNGPAPYLPTYRVQIWAGDHFEAMEPGVNTGTASNPLAWGGEVQFANAWLDEHAEGVLYIGKVVKGETPLAERDGLDWSPGSEGELFDQAADVADAMKAWLGRDTLDAVFWMQGEQDATVEAWADAYAENLAEFTHAVRDEWMDDAFGYIGLGRITDSAALPYSLDVRQAQWLVDQLDPFMESFKTIGFDMQADGLHYAAEGHLAIGQAFFDHFAF